MNMSATGIRLHAGAVINEWHPEDAAFWAKSGNRAANRNLAISIPALLLAFSIWMMFSAVTVCLPMVGFPFSNDRTRPS